MTGNTRVPEAELNGVFGALIKTMSRKMVGKVPEQAGVLWNNPAVFKTMMRMGRKAERWDQLDPNLATFAHMAAASVVGCSFCLDLHYFVSHNRGLDEAKAQQVPRWRESDVFTPLERKVMEYADAMSQTPPAVTDELSAALLDELGAPALVELTTKVGLMNAAARSNVALGIHSEEYSTACGLPPLARAPEAASA
jgi:AhpD family alkylhydroperoxidase